MKNERLKITPKFFTLLVTGGLVLTPVSSNAITNNTYDPGTFVKWIELDDTYDYGIYNVKEGDNWSKISEKVCSHQRVDITTKYWPTLYWYNECPNVIHEGDEIKFPKDHEKLVKKHYELDKSGWISKIKRVKKVYPKKIKMSIREVQKLLYKIYGDTIGVIDKNKIVTYLMYVNKNEKYELKDINTKLTNDQKADICGGIPTVDEFLEFEESLYVDEKPSNTK